MGRGNQSGEEASDTRRSQGKGRLVKPLACKKRTVEINSCKSIDLRIKKTCAQAQVRITHITGGSFYIRFNPVDHPILNDDIRRGL
jgi:hypothetical protein